MRENTADLPLACTLGPDDGPARMERWQFLDDFARTGAARSNGALEIRYDGDPGVHEEVVQLVEAEAECCPFVSWDVRLGAGQVVLRVAALPGHPDDDVVPIALMFGVGE